MNRLCADIGFKSLIKYGEQLCGDHVELVEKPEETILVLADGLGSGVKANILSTMTAKIVSSMLSEGMSLEDCVRTVTATLPVCKVRGVAYSTFTVIRLLDGDEAEFIEYDNPPVILIRHGRNLELPRVEKQIEGKTVYYARIQLCENDILIAMSDGCIHAGIGVKMNFGWERQDIISFMETFYDVGFTARTMNSILLDECSRLYSGRPGDDTTSLTLHIRRREPVNLLIGPPASPADCPKMMRQYFAEPGKRIICGGTTSTLAAEYLGKPLIPHLDYVDPDIPPTAELEGADLVTEGVITINKVLKNAKDFLKANESNMVWATRRDGASLISRMLFEEATDINFYVGRASNPAHQNPMLPITFNVKMQLVEELADCLRTMGKRVRIAAF